MVKQKVVQALDSNRESLEGFTNYQRNELKATTYTSIYLCLNDVMIHEMQSEVITKGK